MAIVRWSPFRDSFRDMVGLQDEVNRLYDTFSKVNDTQSLVEGSWAPSVDIHENKDEIVIDAELPGMNQKDISVTVTDNVLTIKGEKRQEKEVKEENYYRVERSYGAFSRSFTLPVGVKAEQIKATYKDGVLKISLPKAEETKPKQISIDVK
jgi:HSP20 family protein